jgi:competence ComEA-like helix-hairpin-helix protein
MGGPGYVSKDKGKTVILPFMKKKGIKKLDMMIMTHADFDHIGGLIYLINKTKKDSTYPLEIVEFLDPGYPGTTYLYQDLLRAVRGRPEIKYRQPKVGEFLDFGKGVTAQVVGGGPNYPDANNSSIVIKITYGKVSFLLTGDAAEMSERDMISRFGNNLRSTVLSAGHHGSAHSSSTPFLRCVRPEIVTISVGERNKFKLPFKEALDRLNATGAKIYRTDYQGTITVATDGKTYEVVTERKAPPLEERWDVVKVLTEEEKININTASAAELKTLPRIGPARALDIIARRPYSSVDDLRRVPGIGPKIIERLKPLVTVGVPGEEVVPEKKVVPKKKAPALPAPEVSSIGSITQAFMGKRMTLKGKIMSINVFRSGKGRTIKISDGTGSIDVLFWNDLFSQIPERENLKVGKEIRVQGEIDAYRGKLQIKPKEPSDLRILGATPVVKQPPTKRVTPLEKKVLPAGARVNINTASAKELETLPRIGPAKAQAIIAGRPYTTVNDLLKVRGIGPATLEELKPLITVK